MLSLMPPSRSFLLRFVCDLMPKCSILGALGAQPGPKGDPKSPKWLQQALKFCSVIVPLGVSPTNLAPARLGGRFWIDFGWNSAPVQRATGPTCNAQRSIFNVQRSIFDAQDFGGFRKDFCRVLEFKWNAFERIHLECFRAYSSGLLSSVFTWNALEPMHVECFRAYSSGMLSSVFTWSAFERIHIPLLVAGH